MKASTAFASVLVPLALVCLAAPAVSAQDLGEDRDALRRLVVKTEQEPDLRMIRRADGRISLVAFDPLAELDAETAAASAQPVSTASAPVEVVRTAAAAPTPEPKREEAPRQELLLRASSTGPAKVKLVHRF